MTMAKYLLLLLMAIAPLTTAENAYCEVDESLLYSLTAICRNINIQTKEPISLKNKSQNEILKIDLISVTGDVHSDMLQYFSDAKNLIISDSSIHNFSLLSNITTLNVTNSAFPKVTSDVLAGCKQLRDVTFMSNYGLEFENGAFKDLKSLNSLSIYNQSLPRIERSLFEGLENIEWLGLISNGITQIDEDAFLDLPRLERLFLDANPIESLNIKISSLSKSFRLSLFNTNLKHLDYDVIAAIKSLDSIGLSGQLLKNTNATELVAKVPGLTMVGIISTEHQCSEVAPIVEELEKNKIKVMDVLIERIDDVKNFIKATPC